MTPSEKKAARKGEIIQSGAVTQMVTTAPHIPVPVVDDYAKQAYDTWAANNSIVPAATGYYYANPVQGSQTFTAASLTAGSTGGR